MFGKNRMEYVIKSCSAENPQELQNLLNEMSMNGWDLYSMHEVGDEESEAELNCIFMREVKSDKNSDSDIISISDFKSQIERMLSPKLTEYETCLEIQAKIKHEREEINRIKAELDNETSTSRKRLNDRISAGLKELDDLKAQLNKATSPDLMYSKLKEEKLAIYLSEELLGFIDSERENFGEEQLIAETVKSRLKLTEEIGYIFPKVVFKDDENLNPCEFSIKIRGIEMFKATVYPEYKVFYADEIHTEHKIKNSVELEDEITNRKIVWIPKNLCKDFWQKGMTSSEYIAHALEYVTIKHVDDLLDYEDIDKYLNVVEKENAFLVDNIVPDVLNYSDIKYIMTSLIKEKVSIKNITYVFEKINDFAQEGGTNDILNKIRLSLSRQICKNYVNEDAETISAFELSEKTLSEVIIGFDDTEDSLIRIDGSVAEKIADRITKKAKKLNIYNPCVIVPMEYRQILFTLLSLYINNISVLAQEELSCYFKLDSLGEV
ncbi:FHIPEP family type III secretion protein [bacterium]|nr:FHIPEP family type III secretion protein [bacterium]